MKNKGFTIIELLAVIVLLSIIATITYVSIGSGMDKSKEKLYKEQIVTLKNAARDWTLKNGKDIDKEFDGSNCKENSSLCEEFNNQAYYKLSFYKLYSDGYIKSNEVKNPQTGEDLSGCIGIFYNNSLNQYEVNYLESCVINN